MNDVGDRIKKTRLSQGMSQVELAKAVDVSQPTVANWENSSHIPRQAVLNRLSDILKISAQWLLGGDRDQNGYTQIPRKYLETPIKHIPILAWPDCNDIKENEIEDCSAQDYITISTLAKKPFALVINHHNFSTKFPIGTTIIFDAEIDNMKRDSYYLFIDDQDIVFRRWQKAPGSPNKQTMPLAKALFSVQQL